MPIDFTAVPRLLVDLPCKTGEGPIWDDRRNVLFWVDIPAGRVYRYDPATGVNDLAFQHEHEVGGCTIQEDGSLLLFCSFGTILRFDPDTNAVRTVLAAIPGEEESRFNDVEATPDGSVLCGTMPSPNHLGKLYRLFPDGSITEMFDNIRCSNGIGFSPDLRTIYYTDTGAATISALDYDAETGAISNRRVLIDETGGEGMPDGMTVDANGVLWSAHWNGWRLSAFTPEGDEIGSIRFPVRKVSSIAFGGPDLATAFISTAAADGRSEHEGEQAGSLYAIDLGVMGKPPFRSKIGC